MTKADLIGEVSRLTELTRKDSEVIVETIFDSVVRSLRVGDKIEIRGFGSFRTRQRKGGPQSQDRRAGGSPGQENSFLQAQPGTQGSGEWSTSNADRGGASRSHPADAVVRCCRLELDPGHAHQPSGYSLLCAVGKIRHP